MSKDINVRKELRTNSSKLLWIVDGNSEIILHYPTWTNRLTAHRRRAAAADFTSAEIFWSECILILHHYQEVPGTYHVALELLFPHLRQWCGICIFFMGRMFALGYFYATSPVECVALIKAVHHAIDESKKKYSHKVCIAQHMPDCSAFAIDTSKDVSIPLLIM